MAMVGLFWIAEDGGVYIGAKPDGYGRGVRLTSAGVEGLGTDQGGHWAWAEVRGVAVKYVKIRSAGRLLVGAAFDLVGTAVTGHGDAPGAFEVHVDTGDGSVVELEAYMAPAGGGYVPSEYELSMKLLDRLAGGTANVDALEAWGRTHGIEGTPRREEREALLKEWAS
ncbi:hypothetical protein PV726_07015 [Streptomyces europaeiscabiei]|uniref:hypothetical protein n=1 Tax=Streptomyces europaeiscabiei TaxID=146819 RepID=UPI0029AF61A6|nr:hypothetical protein [Streptomyces europaeiscabiei]MDX3690089.1 hypothetical protein [Streptomyces europaeiscabiei]